jgi:hypothetical protein
VASRIYSSMRWGLLLILLGAGGCTRPNDEYHPPFLELRGYNSPEQEDQPDAGPIPAQAVDTNEDPSKPVD